MSNPTGQTQNGGEAFLARLKFLETVPSPYRHMIGNDPTRWEAERAAARQQLRDDAKAAGVELVDAAAKLPKPGTHDLTPAQEKFAAGLAQRGLAAAAAGASRPGYMNLSPGQAAFAAGLKIPE